MKYVHYNYPERPWIDLMLTFPPDGYRTRSIAALETMIRDFLHRQDIVK